MDNHISITIIILTLTITIIPFTGYLWSIKDNRIKIFKRGIIFLFAALIALIFGIVQIYRESSNQELRDGIQNTTLFNTEKIINNLDSITSNIEFKLRRIDSLNSKLDSLEVKTIASIDRRNEILNSFNRLNNQLEKIYTQQDLKIKENIPNVNILNDVRWVKERDIYGVELIFTNSGERLAKDLNIRVLFLGTDNFNRIINYKYLSNDLIGRDELPPIIKTHKNLRFHFPNYPQKTKNDTLPTGYIYVAYNYMDFITDSLFNKVDRYLWRGTKLDGLTWKSMPKSTSKYVDEYLKENRIEINCAEQK